MKILLLAPQPFFQERGTPIAVRLAAEVLSNRDGDTVHLLTYHEGKDVDLKGVHHFRSWMPLPVRNVGPGISLKKIICDFFFLFSVINLLIKARKDQYDLIHAVEESVFIALLVKIFTGIPYIYDMDSSLALQITEKWPLLIPLKWLLSLCEKLAVKGSMAVVPVCDALAVIANKHGSRDTHILRDISLLETDQRYPEAQILRETLPLRKDDVVFLYIGNLESYQGIDLLLDSFALCKENTPHAKLVIIGGVDDHISSYQKRIQKLGLTNTAHLTGPRPVAHLHEYLIQADVLVSPRTDGNNTPMKIYSYLHSGIPVLATNLPTHTQVLTNEVSCLAAPTTKDFSDAIQQLATDQERRQSIGSAAKLLAEKEYTFEVFTERLNQLYDRVEKRVQAEPAGTTP